MATYVIGDIHGEIKALQTIINKINYQPQKDKLIFLGDYIDRGENPYQVYQYLKKLANGKNIFLRGNHEQLMIDTLLNDQNPNLWYYNGGRKTEQSFPNQSLLKEAAKWFDSLSYYYVDQNYIFVHAGLDPDKKLSDQDKNDLIWIRSKFINSKAADFIEKRTIIAGHTPVAEVKFLENKIMLDTGAGKGGILSSIRLEDKEIFQSEAKNPLTDLL